MKRVLSLLCCAAMVLTMCTFYMGAVAGTVSAADYEPTLTQAIFTGTTYDDLVAFVTANSGKEIVLQNDVVANAGVTYEYSRDTGLVTIKKDDVAIGTIDSGIKTGAANCNVFTPAVEGKVITDYLTANKTMGDLTGTVINGNGNSIKGLYLVDTSMIGAVNSGAGIKNLTIDVLYRFMGESAPEHNAAIAKYMYGFAKDLTVNSYVFNTKVGAYFKLAGVFSLQRKRSTDNNVATVDGVTVNGVVAGAPKGDNVVSVGGIVAQNRGGKVVNCVNNADVIAHTKSYATGGVVALVEGDTNSIDTEIINCANTGSIYGVNVNTTAGVIGFADTLQNYTETYTKIHFNNLYNSGAVTAGGAEVAGVIGSVNSGTNKAATRNSVWEHLYTSTSLVFRASDYVPDMRVGGGHKGANTQFSAVKTAFNNVASTVPGLKPWTDDGVIDQSASRSTKGTESDPIVISTAEEYEAFALLIDSTYSRVIQPELWIEIDADIDFNPGYSFSYDETLRAEVITDGENTWYLGSGYGDLAMGKFYDAEGTEITAPALNMVQTMRTFAPWANDNTVGRGYKLHVDGNGHKLEGIYLAGTSDIGLFTNLGYKSSVKDLELDGVVTSTAGNVSALIGYAGEFELERITNNADIFSTGLNNGGLIGYAIYNKATPWTGSNRYGTDSFIYGCINTGNIVAIAASAGSLNVGGIVGFTRSGGYFRYNVNAGDLYGTTAFEAYNSSNELTNYFANVGGIVGYTEIGYTMGNNLAAPIKQTVCFDYNGNTGNITANSPKGTGHVGGCFGFVDCYWMTHGIPETVTTLPAANGYTTEDYLVSQFSMDSNYSVGLMDLGATGTYSNSTRHHGSVNPNGGGSHVNVKPAVIVTNAQVRTDASDSVAYRQYFLTHCGAEANGSASDIPDYILWVDYKYINDGYPVPVYNKDLQIYGCGTAESPLSIGNAAALAFLNETTNYVTDIPGVTLSNGKTVNNINAAIDNKDGLNVTGGTEGWRYANAAANEYLANVGASSTKLVTTFEGLHLALSADINFGGKDWIPMYNLVCAATTGGNEGVTPPYRFKGTFDGAGKTVSGLNGITKNNGKVGFFGGNGGTIKNLTIADSTFTNAKTGAVAVTYYNNGSLSNVTVEADVTVSAAGYAAGFFGWLQGGSISGLINKATINSTASKVAGIAAVSNGGFTNSKNYGTITGTDVVGGLLGYISSSNYAFSGNENHGKVTATAGSASGHIAYLGGGSNNVTFTNCINTGDVSATSRAGAIAAWSEMNSITLNNCSNNAKISVNGACAGGFVGEGKIVKINNGVNEGKVIATGANAGGFIAKAVEAYVNNSINRATVSGTDLVAGIVGETTTHTDIRFCKNYGEITATGGNVAGIVGHAVASKADLEDKSDYGFIVGNENFADVSTTKNSGPSLAGIVGWAGTRGATTDLEVAFNINHGDVIVNNVEKGTNNYGGIIGTGNFKWVNSAADAKADVFSNIQLGTVYMQVDAEGNKIVDNQNHSVVGWQDGTIGYNRTTADAANLANGFNTYELNTRAAGWESVCEGVTGVKFYQTLGVDAAPTLDSTHEEVIKVAKDATVPEAAEIAGKTFVGYVTSAGDVFKAGVANNTGADAYVNKFGIEFYTVFGAGVRAPANVEKEDLAYTGLRFVTNVNAADIARLKKVADTSTLFGTVIMPTDYLESYTFDNAATKLDIPNGGWNKQKDGINTYAGSIIKMKEVNYDRMFSSASYVRIAYANADEEKVYAPYQTAKDGTEFTYEYNAAANSRSIVAVATEAVKDTGKYSENMLNVLRSYLVAANAAQ